MTLGVRAFLASTIGRKAVMAATGLVLFGFVVAMVAGVEEVNGGTIYTIVHLVSAALHAGNALLFFAFLRGTTGRVGASLFAAAILPISTATSVCEAMGWERGVDRKFAQAPQYYFVYTLTMGIGAVVARGGT